MNTPVVADRGATSGTIAWWVAFMKLAYSVTYSIIRSLDVVLPGIFAFVRYSRQKTTLESPAFSPYSS